MNPNELLVTKEMVQRWRDPYAAVKAADVHQPIATLPRFASAEVTEAEQEHNLEGTLLYNFFDHAKELADVLVFLFSFCTAHGILPDFIEAWHRANGQGKKTPIYDTLREKAVNLPEGNVEKNVNDFLMYVISLSHYLPHSLNIVEVMDKVLEKNSQNRPVEFYNSIDIDGRRLSPFELTDRYKHNEKMFRFLRNQYGSPLEPWMYQPFKHLILDFRHSEQNYGLLQAEVERANYTLAARTLDFHVGRQMTSRQLERGLLLAGARPLTAPQGELYSAA